MLPLKLHASSGTVTEYRPLVSTVTAMLPLPTIVTVLWAGIARTKEKTAKSVLQTTKGNLEETVFNITYNTRVNA
jgi:hypothetical protein